MSEKVRIKSWSCRVFRWLKARDIDRFLPEDGWMAKAFVILSVVGSVCVAATVVEVALILANVPMERSFRVFLCCLGLFFLFLSAGILFGGFSPIVYSQLVRTLRGRLAHYFGDKIAEATKGSDYLIHQGGVDRKLEELADRFNGLRWMNRRSEALIVRTTFWAAHNVAWAWGFSVRSKIGDYFEGVRS